MTKLLKSLWARFLFQGRGILPTKRLLFVFLILSAGFIVGTTWDITWRFVIVGNIAFLFISFVDLLFSPSRRQLSIKRSMPEEMERGIIYTVQIELRNRSAHSFYYRLIDGVPQSFQTEFPLTGIVPKQSTASISYDTKALHRGQYELKSVCIRYQSLLGLWEKHSTVPVEDSVKVIPDLTETKQYLENAQQFLMHEGVKIRKHQNGVGEFAKIRSFVVGDDPRTINWRQTAKLQEVMTNEFEPEHGKYITILLDCGRMMGVELKHGNRLEKALEAALTVAVAALQKGDYVAVLAFSREVTVFVPPAKGIAHIQTILQSIYHLQVEAVESNYAAVFSYLEMVQKKRSLLLLFSDIGAFLHEESALLFFKRLRQRHLFLMIGIEDQTLLTRAKAAPSSVQAAMLKSMAQQQILSKKKEKVKWERQGLQMVEAKEEKLATVAVSHYIEIMNRNLL